MTPVSGYAMAHGRIRKTKARICEATGCERTDTEIALKHGHGTRSDIAGAHAGIPYSLLPEDYVALCRSHHRLYDLEIDEGPAARQLANARAAISYATCHQCGRTVRATGLPMHIRTCGKDGPRCIIEDCHREAKSRGWCNTHYERWRKHGDPLTVAVSSSQFAAGHIPHNARG